MTATAIAIEPHQTRHQYLNVTLGILFFAVGSFIYLAFCPTDLLLYDWFGIDANATWILSLREMTTHWQVPQWVRWNLSDGLWLLSYLMIIDSIWNDDDSRYNDIFGLSMLILAVLAEGLQAKGYIPGTGDWYDVFTYIISYTIYKSIKNYEKKY